jgi:hypothetical protein
LSIDLSFIILNSHSRPYIETPLFCRKCPELQFSTQSEKNFHIKTAHPNYFCVPCQKGFRKKSEYETHLLTKKCKSHSPSNEDSFTEEIAYDIDIASNQNQSFPEEDSVFEFDPTDLLKKKPVVMRVIKKCSRKLEFEDPVVFNKRNALFFEYHKDDIETMCKDIFELRNARNALHVLWEDTWPMVLEETEMLLQFVIQHFDPEIEMKVGSGLIEQPLDGQQKAFTYRILQ